METVTSTASNTASNVVIYAGFWKRFIAYIIDFLVIFSAGAVLGFIIGALLGPIEISENSARLLGVLIVWPYFAICESSGWQGTVGKKVLGLKVTDIDGNPIAFGKASVRYFSKILSGLIVGIGYFMAGFTEKKQALHDIIADCLVVCK